MNGTLRLSSSTLAYGDVGSTSNPQKKYVDWAVDRSYQVGNPKSESYTVDPGASLPLFSGVRTTAIDNTTELSLTLSTLASDRYRFTWTGVGTAPGFRTDRALTLATHAVTMTANANLTLSMAATTGDFTTVAAGDTILIPDVTTGDAASPFNPLNTGYWVVLSKDGTSTILQLARPAGSGFTGFTETVTVASNGQVLGYSAAGIQIGDSVNISAAFPTSVQNTFRIVAVTSKWFEVLATQPLPIDIAAVPTAAGIQFYSAAKRYIKFEVDQECVLRLNGDTGNSNRVSPWASGDQDNTGVFEKAGPCWSATIINLSNVPMNLLFISAE